MKIQPVFINSNCDPDFFTQLQSHCGETNSTLVQIPDLWAINNDFSFKLDELGTDTFPIFITHSLGSFILANHLETNNYPHGCSVFLIEPELMDQRPENIARFQALANLEKSELTDYIRQYYVQLCEPSEQLNKMLKSMNGKENYLKSLIKWICDFMQEPFVRFPVCCEKLSITACRYSEGVFSSSVFNNHPEPDFHIREDLTALIEPDVLPLFLSKIAELIRTA
jgi:hypothetical protein